MIGFARRQVVANRYLSVVGHPISVLLDFHVEGCGNHFVLVFNASVSV